MEEVFESVVSVWPGFGEEKEDQRGRDCILTKGKGSGGMSPEGLCEKEKDVMEEGPAGGRKKKCFFRGSKEYWLKKKNRKRRYWEGGGFETHFL